jgi:short-subunit dehydrogenase
MERRTGVVTGVSRGIGRTVPSVSAEDDARAVICARNAGSIQSVTERIRAEGGETTAIRADVCDQFDVRRV